MTTATPRALDGSDTAATPGQRAVDSAVVPHYVWELPVRLAHWLIALSIAVLAFTGFYIGHPFIAVPGEARHHFVMGTMKAVHFYAAIVFTLAVLSRIIWMFLGNRYARWDQYVPVHRQRWRTLVQIVLFYTFLRREPPPVIGHNPLAGLTYLVVYALCLLAVATGLSLYAATAAADSPLKVFDFLVPVFGGLATARWIHHIVMWLLLGFFAHHIFSALLMSNWERTGTMESIFSGFKFVRRDTLEQSRREPRT